METTDAELVERVLLGETEVFGILVRRWERPIYSLAVRMLGRDEDAYDICQETFLSAFRNLNSFRGEAKFSSWLYRIAINCCHSRLRKHSEKSNTSIDEQVEEYGLEPSDHRVDLHDELYRREAADLVRKALAALPPEMRQVIVMKEYEGLKFHEIADILGIPVSTVKTRLYTGLTYMRKRLEHVKDAL
ncbi:MAG: sigma-70 family RNA polymerase sigma factor [Acidobacteria bacterium]|nr:sigma-70 family RNA polymerase sigma factor [Acidobacteriota bacterium]